MENVKSMKGRNRKDHEGSWRKLDGQRTFAYKAMLLLHKEIAVSYGFGEVSHVEMYGGEWQVQLYLSATST